MKQIPLTNSPLFVMVDDEDYDFLIQIPWYLSSTGYCQSAQLVSGKCMLIHRLIMNTPHGMDTDHRDADKFNNQRHNLRIATKSQNHMNRRKKSGTTSIYKGVCKKKGLRKWYANIYKDRKCFPLGAFKNEKDAAIAYNEAAKKLFGEFARLNEVLV